MKPTECKGHRGGKNDGGEPAIMVSQNKSPHFLKPEGFIKNGGFSFHRQSALSFPDVKNFIKLN